MKSVIRAGGLRTRMCLRPPWFGNESSSGVKSIPEPQHALFCCYWAAGDCRCSTWPMLVWRCQLWQILSTCTYVTVGLCLAGRKRSVFILSVKKGDNDCFIHPTFLNSEAVQLRVMDSLRSSVTAMMCYGTDLSNDRSDLLLNSVRVPFCVNRGEKSTVHTHRRTKHRLFYLTISGF